ncbi:hypothetical protein EXS74_00790 [Candidatus Woesearchaeota archaeon]|nr:hypothetical protein [Candidatus Woesearchaeota archaeon]
MNTLHRQEGLRVDIGYGGDSAQLDVCKDGCAERFEIYPPRGITLVTQDVTESQRCAEASFRALPQNSYARDLHQFLEGIRKSDREEENFNFRRYSSDTRSLCRFLLVYFSFLKATSLGFRKQ